MNRKTKGFVGSAEMTIREMDVLELLKLGKTSSEIAEALNIKDRTVIYHVDNIKKKLNATNRTNAVAIACCKKIIKID